MSIDIREDFNRNFIINGNFDFWQRGTTRSVPAGFSAGATYLADRFRYDKGGGAAEMDINRSTDVPTFAESGTKSQYSMEMEVTVAQTVFASGDTNEFLYNVEGYDFLNMFGRMCTLSFWVKASTPGTYCVSARAGADTASYLVEYTINQANTWEKKSVLIDLVNADENDFEFDNQGGIKFTWVQNTEDTFSTSTTDQWQAGVYNSTPNQVNNLSTVGNVFKLSQVQVNIGGKALPFRRAGRNIQQELALCEQYYRQVAHATGTVFTVSASGQISAFLPLNTKMRATPTVNSRNISTGVQGSPLNAQGTVGYNSTQSSFAVGGGSNDSRGMYIVLNNFNTSSLSLGYCVLVGVPGNNSVVFELDAEI